MSRRDDHCCVRLERPRPIPASYTSPEHLAALAAPLGEAWPYTGLRDWQKIEVRRATEAARWLLAVDPRLGKTRATARSIARWVDELGYCRTLVTGPLEPLRIVWTPELGRTGFVPPKTLVDASARRGYCIPLLDQFSIGGGRTHGAANSKTNRRRPSRVDILRDLKDGAARGQPVVLLVNDEALAHTISPKSKTRLVDVILEWWPPQAFIYDEVHRTIHPGSARSRASRRLGAEAQIVRGLTGTPDPNGAQNFYGEFVVVDPTVLGTNQAAFRRLYCDMSTQFPGQVLRYRDLADLYARVLSRATVLPAALCGDVPEIDVVHRDVDLPEEARRWYDQLVRDEILELEAHGIELEATHVFSRLLRCQQLAAGFLPDEDGEARWLHAAKIEAAVMDAGEIVAGGGKVIISHRYVPEGVRLVEALRRRYGSESVAWLRRELDGREREAAIAPFSLDHDVRSPARILVTQEQLGGVGLSLGRADYLIFTSWSAQYDHVEQMRKRIWDAAKRRISIEYVRARKTVDGTFLKFIRQKESESIMSRLLSGALSLRAAALDEDDAA